MMIELISEHAHIFWLALGGLLLAAEMLGAGGYLLWSGVAAIVTGLVAWIVPTGWEWQGICFALITVVTAVLWSRWLKRKAQPEGNNGLNQRGRQLIGQRFRLEQPLVNGRGHVRIGDSSWPVQADADLPAATLVEVTAVDGITLRIKACA